MLDWNCATCNFIVFSYKTSCSKCGSLRPDIVSVVNSEKQQLDLKNNIHEMSDQVYELKDKLTDSEFKNLLDSLKKCHDSTSDITTTSSIANSSRSNRSQQQVLRRVTSHRRNDWMCTNCNFQVFGSKPKCSKCQNLVSYIGECKHSIACKNCIHTLSNNDKAFCEQCNCEVKIIKVFYI